MKPWYAMSESVRGIPMTRFVASWYIGGGYQNIHQVRKWLKSLIIDGEQLTDEEIEVIAQCIVNGKLELESSAKRFLAK